jgi:transcriptional regulator with GAF, ATPase, and Fis domain
MTYSDKQRPAKKTRQIGRSKTGPAPSNEEVERALLLEALNQEKGNITKAAESVGYTPEMFLRALRQHGFGEVM